MFKKNDRVEKAAGHKWPGIGVSAFETTAGEARYVVECTVPEVAGALRIFDEARLTLVERPVSGDHDGHQWVVRPDGLDKWRPLVQGDRTLIEIMQYDGDGDRGDFKEFWWGLYDDFDRTLPSPFAIKQYRVVPDGEQ